MKAVLLLALCMLAGLLIFAFLFLLELIWAPPAWLQTRMQEDADIRRRRHAARGKA